MFGLLGVLEDVRFCDLYLPVMGAISRVVRLLLRRGSCVRCLYDVKAFGPLSLFMIVESRGQACLQCTS